MRAATFVPKPLAARDDVWVVGQRAELPEYGDVVAHGQVLGDQAGVVEGQYVDLPGGDGPVRGG